MPRISVRIDDGLNAEILARCETGEDARAEEGLVRSAALREMLDRYLWILRIGRKTVRRVLTGDELALIADSLNGTITAGQAEVWFANPLLSWSVSDILPDGLAEKWGVDGPALVKKLAELGPAEIAAILDAVERFRHRPEGKDPRRILEE